MQILDRKLMIGTFKLTKKQESVIREKISSLPRHERLSIYFYFWEQYSYFQIARNLCVPVSDVSRLIQNAMVKLRGELSEIADIYFGADFSSEIERVA